MPNQQFKVRLYDDKNRTTLIRDLTDRITRTFNFSTIIQGGFGICNLYYACSFGEAWNALNRENLPGWHYYHLDIREDTRIVWEGRLMNPEIVIESDQIGLNLTALGYHSSMRDQLYDDQDAGNTNWETVAGTVTTGQVLRELVTKSCPDINGTLDIDLDTTDIKGLTALHNRDYPQNFLVDVLAPIAGTGTLPWHWTVYDDRKPKWAERTTSNIDWFVYLRDIVGEGLTLKQQGEHLRNHVLPVIGTAEGTSTTDAESTGRYPRRDIKINLGAGVPNAAANLARDRVIAERRFPQQQSAFGVKGSIYSANAAGLGAIAGALLERPKWWVRAGEIIRVQDLVPASQATPELDALRTFFIMGTTYDVLRDRLSVQPDQPANALGALLSRRIQLERDR